ncbi:MAG: hypothetical protein EZS28_033543, partial [Streblomastix strix]
GFINPNEIGQNEKLGRLKLICSKPGPNDKGTFGGKRGNSFDYQGYNMGKEGKVNWDCVKGGRIFDVYPPLVPIIGNNIQLFILLFMSIPN